MCVCVCVCVCVCIYIYIYIYISRADCVWMWTPKERMYQETWAYLNSAFWNAKFSGQSFSSCYPRVAVLLKECLQDILLTQLQNKPPSLWSSWEWACGREKGAKSQRGIHGGTKQWCRPSGNPCAVWKASKSGDSSTFGTDFGTPKAMLNGTLVVLGPLPSWCSARLMGNLVFHSHARLCTPFPSDTVSEEAWLNRRFK